ncbi:protein tilB homolog isoform X2 [Amia ocellicauda]|uniref:protein tilB homolog isoform X2 n=1 Tax=Amia ocellicauda TaxID=2972642 RepID=UPI003463A891
MSESSSGVVTSSDSFPKSYSSRYSDLSDTNTSLAVVSRNRQTEEQSPDSGIASPLPSDRFRFITWYKLGEHAIQGDQLNSPRVREGPSEEDVILRGQENYIIARRQKEERKKWEERLHENWENCVDLNLSYQDLGDSYQLENFCRILRRLIRVERLQLVDNSLKDLSSIRLPRQLPKIPQIQHLSLAENNIATLHDLSELGTSPLESLTLKRNPCEFQEDYRSQVFSSLPKLKLLDGIPKLPSDCLPSESTTASRMCIIL